MNPSWGVYWESKLRIKSGGPEQHLGISVWWVRRFLSVACIPNMVSQKSMIYSVHGEPLTGSGPQFWESILQGLHVLNVEKVAAIPMFIGCFPYFLSSFLGVCVLSAGVMLAVPTSYPFHAFFLQISNHMTMAQSTWAGTALMFEPCPVVFLTHWSNDPFRTWFEFPMSFTHEGPIDSYIICLGEVSEQSRARGDQMMIVEHVPILLGWYRWFP